MVVDMFVSLRGALAHALIAQAWLMVYVVSLQRVQEPTDIQVRRLNATNRKLQAYLEKIVYQAMTPTGEADLHSDSGYRRLSGDANGEVKDWHSRGKPATSWDHATRQARRSLDRRALQVSPLA
eukprot:7350496-Pyramimonas_sp.AAC.1